MAVCPDCVRGSLDDGTPKGKDTALAGFPCYVSRPATANGCAVVLATDVFGYRLVNSRLIADSFADNGYLCVIPDYFKGTAVKPQLLEAAEAWESKSLLGKIAAAPQLLWNIGDMLLWIRQHPVPYAVEVVTAVAAELKQQHGIKKVGLQGYCYGHGCACASDFDRAKFVVSASAGGCVGTLMAAKPEAMDAVSIAHPGPIKVPADIQAVQVPMLFLCAERDQWFPEKARTAALHCLEEKEPGLGTFILYPGTKHGFAVRGDKRNTAVNAAREDALKQALRFFNKHLAGIQPPVQELDETATPVGVRLRLAPREC